MAATTYSTTKLGLPSHPALMSPDVLRIGTLAIGYHQIAHYTRSALAERDWGGQLMCAAVYGLGSALFLIGILIGSLDLKFLIAVVFLGAICFMSVCDALGTPTITVHTLDIVLHDGRQAQFVDADPRVVGALAAHIEAHGGCDAGRL